MNQDKETEILRSTGKSSEKHEHSPIVTSRLIVGAILFSLLVVAGFSSLNRWQNEQLSDYKEPLYEHLVVDNGSMEFIKPWKTQPYLKLTKSNGQIIKLSCFGPFHLSYWCKDLEKFENKPQDNVTAKWSPLGEINLVFELSQSDTIFTTFDNQKNRFSSAASRGSNNGQFIISLFCFIVALLIIVNIKKNKRGK